MTFRTYFDKFKALILAPIVCVLLFGVFQLGLMIRTEVETGYCLFSQAHETLCEMSPLDHVQAWQSLFVSIPAPSFALLLAIIAAFFSLIGISAIRLISLLGTLQPAYLGVGSPHTRSIPTFDRLREAFSRGILNSKTY